MSRLVLWKVATTTARNALDVAEPEVGNYCLVFTDGTLYKAIKAGTGAGVWESALGLQDVVDDTTPQLGGNLDVNGSSIVSTSNANVNVAPNGTGGFSVSGSPLADKAPVTLTDAANIATDASLGNLFEVTLGGNRTLDNPTNLVAGIRYQWKIIQDGTGSRTLAYGAMFLFAGGAPTLTITAAAVDVIFGTYDGTNLICDVLLDVQA